MKPKHLRLVLIVSTIGGLAFAVFLILTAFQDSLVFFYTPCDLQSKNISSEQRIRIGGLVEKSSLHREGEAVSFTLTDNKSTLKVNYKGLVPDLFREGQGAVAEGYLVNPSLLVADSILAKHDENYMPKEVAESLEKEGCENYAR